MPFNLAKIWKKHWYSIFYMKSAKNIWKSCNKPASCFSKKKVKYLLIFEQRIPLLQLGTTIRANQILKTQNHQQWQLKKRKKEEREEKKQNFIIKIIYVQ